MAKVLLHRARIWDLRGANGVDHFVANSRFTARRIWKVYRRRSTVIHPPVDVEAFTLRENKENFYLTVSRLVPYKRIPEIVDAFRALPNQRLIVVGDGPQMRDVKRIAGRNVDILGFQPTEVVRDLMQRAKAFLFAAEEDFGIVPVEAQACGTPVIAFERGGILDSIRGPSEAKPTGTFFSSQSAEAIAKAILEFEAIRHKIIPSVCRDNALRFSIDNFRMKYSAYVNNRWLEATLDGEAWQSIPDAAEC
jgi:glycosyltransferase involved in cell wall biosynthesis